MCGFLAAQVDELEAVGVLPRQVFVEKFNLEFKAMFSGLFDHEAVCDRLGLRLHDDEA